MPRSVPVRRVRLGKDLSRDVAAHGRLGLTSVAVRRACRQGRSTRHDRRARHRGTAPRGARSTRLARSRRMRLAREGPRPRRGCRPCRPRSSRTCRPADNPSGRGGRPDREAWKGRATARAAWKGRATGCSDRGREREVFRDRRARRSRNSRSPSSGRTSPPRSLRASLRHLRRSGCPGSSPSRGRHDRRSRGPPRNTVRRALQEHRERESSSERRGATSARTLATTASKSVVWISI